MPRAGKNDKCTEQALRGNRKQIKVESLRLQVKNLGKNYNNLAKFPSENPYPVLRIHQDGTILYANKASEPFLKAQNSDIGLPAPPEWHNLAKNALSSGQVLQEETVFDERVFAFRIVPIIESDYVNFYGTDITERKRAEQALRESETRFRTLFEEAIDGFLLADLETKKFHTANPRMCQMLGYSEEELKRLTVSDIHPVESLPRVLEAFAAQAKGDIQTAFEIPVRRKDGTVFYADINSKPFRMASQQYMLGIFHDVTERKKMQEAMLRAQKLSENLINSSIDGIHAYDHQCRYIIWNPAMERISGKKKENVLGRCAFDVFPFLKETGGDKYFYDALAGKTVVAKSRPYKIPETGQQGFFEGHYAPLYDEQNNIIGGLAIVRDITERKKAEEALKESEERYRGLFESSIEGIGLARKNQVIDANPALLKIFGYDNLDEFKKVPLLEHVAPESRSFIENRQRKLQRGELNDDRFEYKIIRKDGQVRDLEISTKYIRLGNDAYALSTFRDVTERKLAEEAMLRRNRVMETITEVNQLVFRVQDRDEMLRNVCETIVQCAYKIVWIGFCNEKSKPIMPEAQAGFEEGYLASIKVTFDNTEFGMGPSGMAVKTAKPNIMRFISTDPRYEPWQAEAIKRGYHSSAAIPIFEWNKVIGVLNVYSDKDDAFGQEEIKLLEELAYDISTGLRAIDEQTKRRQAEQTLIEYQKQLKRLASKLTLAEEMERRRIAGEIHDEISQTLAMAKIKLDTLRNSPPSEASATMIEEISSSVEKVIQETRTLTFELSNPILYELGFEAAVAEWLNENVQEKHGIATEFHDDELPKPLEDDLKVMLFRNVRELLTNCIKHAKAGKITVGLRRIADSIEVIVEDSGVGFDTAQLRTTASKKGKFGLFSIRENMENTGGRFEIESKPGAGCKAIMTAPLKNQSNKKEV